MGALCLLLFGFAFKLAVLVRGVGVWWLFVIRVFCFLFVRIICLFVRWLGLLDELIVVAFVYLIDWFVTGLGLAFDCYGLIVWYCLFLVFVA